MNFFIDCLKVNFPFPKHQNFSQLKIYLRVEGVSMLFKEFYPLKLKLDLKSIVRLTESNEESISCWEGF